MMTAEHQCLDGMYITVPCSSLRIAQDTSAVAQANSVPRANEPSKTVAKLPTARSTAKLSKPDLWLL